ncbi:MAG TPA: hypothetical protein VJ914_30210 [Pseudonocardiaceae bacterium]|nr:hypothetical protein [Pseudonocardiaceae bacterium]
MEYPAEWAAAEEQARELLARGGDMAQVQELLRDLGISVIWSIWVTKRLLESGSLAEATQIVETSAARIEVAAAKRLLASALEHSFAIAETVRELRRPAVVAFDGPGDAPRVFAVEVAALLDDWVVVPMDGSDWERLRDEVLVPARAAQGITLVHGMFLLRPELAPCLQYRVYVTEPPTTEAEQAYLRDVCPQSAASLVIRVSN